MLTKTKPGWALPSSIATDELHFLKRRQICRSIAAGSILACGIPFSATASAISRKVIGSPRSRYPAERNTKYTLDRGITPEKITTTYNNFYEFGSHKNIWQAAQKLAIKPWQVVIDGLVEKEKLIDFEALLKQMPLEERLYRHRCVEAWAIAVPWTGFPIKELLRYARPLTSAKYLVMESFIDKERAPGQRQYWYPWPYREGITIAEAENELSIIGTGAYGKPMPKQNGAPLRLIVPWKYGFKSIKSINTIKFVDKQPDATWSMLAPKEYGFYSNVNNSVDHPRWSQGTERRIGEFKRRKTLMFNGYEEEVSYMYEGMDLKKYY